MSATSSVSKGVFVFNKPNDTAKPVKQSRNKKSKKLEEDDTLESIYSSHLWYRSYKDLWKYLDKRIKSLHNHLFSTIMKNLLIYVRNCYKEEEAEIPAAAILMGINMPDHSEQFEILSNEIHDKISPHVATVNAEDGTSIKLLVENMIYQFVNSDEDDDDIDSEITIKKSLCTFSLLTAWYKNKYEYPKKSKRQKEVRKQPLVVIIPEFESFEKEVLRDFILIVSSYLNQLPFVIILGVSTSVDTLHRTLPYQVTSRMNIQVFSSQSSTEYLNSILYKILLKESCPFHLGGNTFSFFTDIFLFYDFSVKGFIQNFKFSMLEHYSNGNAMSLCTKAENVEIILDEFSHDDCENVRKLMSFREFVESKDYAERIKLLEDDKYFKIELHQSILHFHEYMFCFHTMLICLHELVSDLPGAPLGKQLRELYAIAVTGNVIDTDEYKQCIQLLYFLSKDEFEKKVTKVIQTLKSVKNDTLNEISVLLINITSNYVDPIVLVEKTQPDIKQLHENMNRFQLKEWIKMSREKKSQNVHEKHRDNVLTILTKLFNQHLMVPISQPFHEIFFFNNASSIKNNIVGSHRAAIHTALNNPQCYLQCKCCKLSNDLKIVSTLPDVSIIYKLHLEGGKFINMYDWLQAFVTIVSPSDNDELKNIDPKYQARFARAVAELEFLGFIKSSLRKTDHVQRLTWGCC